MASSPFTSGVLLLLGNRIASQPPTRTKQTCDVRRDERRGVGDEQETPPRMTAM